MWNKNSFSFPFKSFTVVLNKIRTKTTRITVKWIFYKKSF